MKYFTLEKGDRMPVLGLGTWKSAKGEVYSVVRKAIEVGYRHFDCAHVYGNEQEIGDAFSDAFKAGDVTREALWITSKLWNNRHRKEQTQAACEKTLADLQLDYLDLYLIHWPIVIVDEVNYPNSGKDMVSLTHTPLSETWEGMIDIKSKGLAQHIGVSNFSAKKIQGVWDATGVKPEVNQVEIHPFLQQKALKTYCDDNGIFLTGYSPLGSADRPANRITAGEPKLFENDLLKNKAAAKGISVAQLILAWAVNYGVSVIPKSVNPSRLIENLAAADIELTAEDVQAIGQLDLHNRYISGAFWCLEGSDYKVETLWDE